MRTALLHALLGVGIALFAADQALEHHVKAAFLLNFTRFVEWAPAALPPPDQPFLLCISGEDPFGAVLDKIVEGETVAGRKLEVRRIESGEIAGCQVLYAGGAPADLSKGQNRPQPGILLVGEGPAFLREGGMIAFVVENRRVRFDVNQATATAAGIRISSKLLSVARRVER